MHMADVAQPIMHPPLRVEVKAFEAREIILTSDPPQGVALPGAGEGLSQTAA